MIESFRAGRHLFAPARPQEAKRSALVGLSGGVDSAVAAWLLLEQGFQVTAVTFNLWQASGLGSEKEGIPPHNVVARAEAVADRLGIEHMVVDASEAF